MIDVLELPEKEVQPTEYGKVEGQGDARRVEIRREIKASVSEVWRAITTPDTIAQWFTACEFELAEGATIKMMFPEEPRYNQKEHTTLGEIKVVLPERIFGYTWDYDGISSWHQFDLFETEAGTTVLTMVATGMTPEDGFSVGVGWHQMSERLAHLLEHGEGVRLEFDRIKEIFLHYKGRYGPKEQG